MKGTILLLSFAIATLFGCAKNKVDNNVNKVIETTEPTDTTAKKPLSGTFTYLALGDSYTIGQSVDLNGSFPYQLTAQLNLRVKVITPPIIARTGWTTTDLISGISYSSAATNTYDFVTLLIGVNDQFQGLDQDGYRARFAELVKTAIKFAKGDKTHVFVISIPDYSVTPYVSSLNRDAKGKIATEIDQFNGINKIESDKVGVNYLNITDISRQAAADPTLLAPDGLHPSAKMYGLWVQRLLPMVKSKL